MAQRGHPAGLGVGLAETREELSPRAEQEQGRLSALEEQMATLAGRAVWRRETQDTCQALEHAVTSGVAAASEAAAAGHGVAIYDALARAFAGVA